MGLAGAPGGLSAPEPPLRTWGSGGRNPPYFDRISSTGRLYVARVQLFLFTVSTEFITFRYSLRHSLTRSNVEVKEDFIVSCIGTLQVLNI